MNIKASQSSFSGAQQALSPLDQSRTELLAQPLPPKPICASHKITKLPSSGSYITRHLITNRHGLPLGFVEKFRDDRCTVNPWKAFVGIGADCKMIAVFYKEDGGKAAAVNAVINAS